MEIHSIYAPGYTYRIPAALAAYFKDFMSELKEHLEWFDEDDEEEKKRMHGDERYESMKVTMLKVDKLIEQYDDQSLHFRDHAVDFFRPSSLVLLEAAFQDGTFDEKYPKNSFWKAADSNYGKNYYDIFGDPIEVQAEVVEGFCKDCVPFYGVVMTKEFIHPDLFADLNFCAGSGVVDCHTRTFGEKSVAVFDYDNESG